MTKIKNDLKLMKVKFTLGKVLQQIEAINSGKHFMVKTDSRFKWAAEEFGSISKESSDTTKAKKIFQTSYQL
jgi:hypothetical protein